MTKLDTLQLNGDVNSLEKEVELYNCGLRLRLTEFTILEIQTAKKDLQLQISGLQDLLLTKEKQAVAAMAVGANSLYDDISLLIQRKQDLLRGKQVQVRQCEEKQRGQQLLLEHTRLRLRQCQQQLLELAVVRHEQPENSSRCFAQQVADEFRKEPNGRFVKNVKTAFNNVIGINPDFGYNALPVPH